MRKKYVYLPIMSALSIALTACIDSGSSNNIGSGTNNEAPSTTLGSGGCGIFNSAKSIEIDNIQTLTKGASKGLSAYVVCKDGKKFDITADGSTNWSSNDYNIIEVDNKNYKGKVTGVGVGNATLKVVHDGLTATKQISVVNSYCGTSAQMMGAHVEPAKIDSLPVGGEAELHLYADCTNNTQVDITNYATWQSSSKLTVEVNDEGHKGLITGKQRGSANISATLDGQKVYDHKINVDSALLKSLEVSADTNIAKGLTSQLKVIGVYADGDNIDVTKITKYSVVYGDITIDENGLIHATGEGNFKIQASLNGKFEYLEGHVTGAKLLNFTLDNNNLVFTPYLNTSASIKATAHYSDGRTLPISTKQLQCEMDVNQTNIIQNQTSGCTFSQLGEVNAKVNIKVTYLNDLSVAEQHATASVSLAPIKGIQLLAKGGEFFVGNMTPYKVNLLLADNKIVDITKNLILKVKVHNLEQEYTPTIPLLFDKDTGDIIFNKPITPLTPYTLVASIGDSKTGHSFESSISYNQVHTNEISIEELNDMLVSTFKDEILKKLESSGAWDAVAYKDSKAHATEQVTKFFAGMASSKSKLLITTLSDDDNKKVSNVYNKVIDYDENDSEFKVTARLERNPSNGSQEVVLSEFCNNTPVTQTFSSASITTSRTDGFSYANGYKAGFDIAVKGKPGFLGFQGELTVTTKFEYSRTDTWSNQDTKTFSLGGATVTLPPRKHAIVVSTIHTTDYYYDGKLPLKINGEFPVIFRIIDAKNNIKGVGVIDLAKIYVSGKNTYLDRFFELSNHKLYLDLSPQVNSSGGSGNRTVTHSVYFVDDNQTGTLGCIYPNMLQNTHNLSKQYKSGDIQALSHQHGFEFLNRKPDLINTQY